MARSGAIAAVDSLHRGEQVRALSPSERWTIIAESYARDGQTIARRLWLLTGDIAAIDDLVNDTFVRAFEALFRFEGRSELRTWILGIAHNVARAHIAKRSRRSRLIEGVVDNRSPPTPEGEAQEREALDRLHAALDDLGAEQREAFVHLVLEGRSLRETSEILDVPISTLHARCQRAEQHVRCRLAAENDR